MRSMGDKLFIYFTLYASLSNRNLGFVMHFDLGLLINCFYLNKCSCFSIVFFSSNN